VHDRDPDRLLADFRADVRHGRLPKVSWIVAPEAYGEHPNWEPDYGSWCVSQVVVLEDNHRTVQPWCVRRVVLEDDKGTVQPR
jgi:phospholipase C